MNKPILMFMVSLLTPIALTVLAAADAARCLTLYKSRCVACLSVDENRVGPAHQGVFGRRAGRVVGYKYSEAVIASKLMEIAPI